MDKIQFLTDISLEFSQNIRVHFCCPECGKQNNRLQEPVRHKDVPEYDLDYTFCDTCDKEFGIVASINGMSPDEVGRKYGSYENIRNALSGSNRITYHLVDSHKLKEHIYHSKVLSVSL